MARTRSYFPPGAPLDPTAVEVLYIQTLEVLVEAIEPRLNSWALKCHLV